MAETDDALLEKYLDKGELADGELRAALRAGRRRQADAGAVRLGREEYRHRSAARRDRRAAAGAQRAARAQGHQCRNGEPVERAPDPAAPFSALVFKTVIDPFAGKLSIFRVVSGRAISDATVLNSTRGVEERFGQLLRLEGKKQSPLASRAAGRDRRGRQAQGHHHRRYAVRRERRRSSFPRAERPAPVISFAIRPKTKGDEEKASQALQRLVEEDPALEMHRDPQTHEIILSGTGQLHIEVTVEKLKRKFNVEVELQAPKVPYKETIKGRAESQGKYKRQSGGRGQYGDCWLKVEPLPRGGGFEFVDEIVGGAVPRQFIPSVEKGVRNTLPEGFLAGYPMVDVKVTVYDGSYHDVDSSDMAFQIAASMGFKAALEKAQPILLEPIMALEVSCPDECMGDVIGDLNSRRGKVLGMDRKGHGQVIKALVPMSEILKYAPDLRSITSGRGSFESQFSHYEEVPRADRREGHQGGARGARSGAKGARARLDARHRPTPRADARGIRDDGAAGQMAGRDGADPGRAGRLVIWGFGSGSYWADPGPAARRHLRAPRQFHLLLSADDLDLISIVLFLMRWLLDVARGISARCGVRDLPHVNAHATRRARLKQAPPPRTDRGGRRGHCWSLSCWRRPRCRR